MGFWTFEGGRLFKVPVPHRQSLSLRQQFDLVGINNIKPVCAAGLRIRFRRDPDPFGLSESGSISSSISIWDSLVDPDHSSHK